MKQEVLGVTVTIDDKLSLTPRLGNIIKKRNQKLHALSRVKHYMGFEQNKFIISYFIKFQFSYCPLVWIFGSRTTMNNDKGLRLITNNWLKNFNELPE